MTCFQSTSTQCRPPLQPVAENGTCCRRGAFDRDLPRDEAAASTRVIGHVNYCRRTEVAIRLRFGLRARDGEPATDKVLVLDLQLVDVICEEAVSSRAHVDAKAVRANAEFVVAYAQSSDDIQYRAKRSDPRRLLVRRRVIARGVFRRGGRWGRSWPRWGWSARWCSASDSSSPRYWWERSSSGWRSGGCPGLLVQPSQRRRISAKPAILLNRTAEFWHDRRLSASGCPQAANCSTARMTNYRNTRWSPGARRKAQTNQARPPTVEVPLGPCSGPTASRSRRSGSPCTSITVALVVTMVLLGRWQLTVSEHKHFGLQNFGYALQWWAFSAFDARHVGPRPARRTPQGPEREHHRLSPPLRNSPGRLPSLRHAAARRATPNRSTPSAPPTTSTWRASRPATSASERNRHDGQHADATGAPTPPAPASSASRSPGVSRPQLDDASGALKRYRIMAFVTGVDPHRRLHRADPQVRRRPCTRRARHRPALGRARLAVPGLRDRHRGARRAAALAARALRAGHAGRDDPDDVVRRRALRHPRRPARRRSDTQAGSARRRLTRPRPTRVRPTRSARARATRERIVPTGQRAHVGRLGVGQPDHLGEDERLAPLGVERGDQRPHRHRARPGRPPTPQPARRQPAVALRRAHRVRAHPAGDRQQPGPRRRAAERSGAATRTPARRSPASGRRPAGAEPRCAHSRQTSAWVARTNAAAAAASPRRAPQRGRGDLVVLVHDSPSVQRAL